MSTEYIDERWKDVPGYEGRYMVSDHGRVRSLSRQVCSPIACKTIREVVMNLRKNNNGYIYVFLKTKSTRKKFYIHRLVAMAFFDKPPDDAIEVNHKDKVRSNNHYSNLEWLNHVENCAHRDEVF